MQSKKSFFERILGCCSGGNDNTGELRLDRYHGTDLIFVWTNKSSNGEVVNFINGKERKRNNSMALYGLDSIMSMTTAGGLGGKTILYYDCKDQFKMLTSSNTELLKNSIEFKHVSELFNRTLMLNGIDYMPKMKEIYKHEMNSNSGKAAFAANVIKLLASHFHTHTGTVLDMGVTIDCENYNKNDVWERLSKNNTCLSYGNTSPIFANTTIDRIKDFCEQYEVIFNLQKSRTQELNEDDRDKIYAAFPIVLMPDWTKEETLVKLKDCTFGCAVFGNREKYQDVYKNYEQEKQRAKDANEFKKRYPLNRTVVGLGSWDNKERSVKLDGKDFFNQNNNYYHPKDLYICNLSINKSQPKLNKSVIDYSAPKPHEDFITLKRKNGINFGKSIGI